MMRDAVCAQLVALNRAFYREFAGAFSASRYNPWQGFARIAELVPQPCPAFADVGCGDGRLGRFLWERGLIGGYVGVDFSAELLQIAELGGVGTFYERNLLEPGALQGIGRFSFVASLATLHHIPSHALRCQLLAALAELLEPGGKLVLTNWQFWQNERQQGKICAWERVGLRPEDVEEGDYLVAWRGGGAGVRYVHALSADKIAQLSAEVGLTLVEQFYSDGKEGNLNLYSVLALP